MPGSNVAHIREERERRARDLLSLREAAVLADINADRVRKDIETGLLDNYALFRHHNSRLCFGWPHVFTLAAAYKPPFFDPDLRRAALDKFAVDCHVYVGWSEKIFDNWLECVRSLTTFADGCSRLVYLDAYVSLDVGKICDDVKPRVDLYAEGLKRVAEKKDSVLGGEAVFLGSRTSVCHIGKMYDRGAPLDEILTDYPHLSDTDVKFAGLYYRAHPPVGRPRASVEARDDAPIAG